MNACAGGSRGKGREGRAATAGGGCGAKRAEAPNWKWALRAAAADPAAAATGPWSGPGGGVSPKPAHKRKRVLPAAAGAAATGGGARRLTASKGAADKDLRRRKVEWTQSANLAGDVCFDPSGLPAVRCLRRDEELESDECAPDGKLTSAAPLLKSFKCIWSNHFVYASIQSNDFPSAWVLQD